LTRVRAETLDEATLAFSVQRVHREAALASAGNPRDDHDLTWYELEIDALQVVGLSALENGR